MPLSDLVGLVLVTVIISPERRVPPTNSLPPRRCPCPMFLGDEAAGAGDSGGLRNVLSDGEVDGSAPGLKEKEGSATGEAGRASFSTSLPKARSAVSIADRGRRPVARERDEGADEGEARAGKTKGGLGSGAPDRGEVWALGTGSFCSIMSSPAPGTDKCACAVRLKTSVLGVSTTCSGPAAVAIFPKPRCGTRSDGQLRRGRVTLIRSRKATGGREWSLV